MKFSVVVLVAATSLTSMVQSISIQTVATSSTTPTPQKSFHSPSLADVIYTNNGRNGIDTLINATIHHEAHKQVARVISDQTWNELLQNGCRLVNMMSISDSQAAELMLGKPSTVESIWRNYPDDFTDWGYEQEKEAAMNFKYRRAGPHLEEAYTALGIDSKKTAQGGPNVPIGWNHKKQTKHDGITYEPTQAQFFTIVNVEDGVLVGWYKYGPFHTGQQQVPKVTVLPKLKDWADIAFLKWKSQAEKHNKPLNNLKYIFSAMVANSQSNAVLGRALGHGKDFDDDEHCSEIEGWERKKEWGLNTDEGKVLLASPNGRDAALTLIKHKGTFGVGTRIDRVAVWCSKKNDWELNWVFFVNHNPL